MKAVLEQQGFGATADALFKGRLRDLDNDGVGDPGGDFWTADSFHTRDVIRQTEVDWMQLIRLLKTFDGKTVMDSVDGKAATSLAGDFNGDGVVDVGGPNADFFIWGESLGGILSAVLPAVEPSISAAAPVAAAGGLSDVGLRSTLGAVIDAVLLEVLGPMVSSCQWDAQTGACTGGEPHDALVWVVQQVSDEAHVLIARAPHVTFKAGDLVKVENLASGKVKTALVDSAGHVRVPIAADGPEYPIDYSKDPEHKLGKWDLTPGHFKDGDAMRITLCAANSDGTACAAGATPQVVTTYQDLAQSYHDDATGKDVALPVRFIGRPYPVGSPLVSPARGFGLERETPEFRRFWNLAEMTLEPGDPATYAPHWFEDLLPARANRPANVLLVLGAGDPIVPTSAGLNLARAGGLLDFEHLDPVYGATDNDVLLAGHVMEGIARLKRFVPDAAGYAGTAPRHAHVTCDALSDCAGETLLDVTGYSCDAQGASCADGFGTPRLTPPLKAQLEHDTCAGGRKGAGFTNCGTSALLLPMLNPHGQHGFTIPNPNAGFDYDTFLANKIFHFFETRGEDLVDDKCLAAEVNLEKSKVTPACAFMPQPPQP